MENKINFSFFRPVMEESFKNGESFTFKPTGVSMRPFIKGGETTVTVEKYIGGAKKFDIIFYEREDGKYVMHRIVKVYPEFFGVCGDNQWWVEKVCENQIFSIVTEVDGIKKKGTFLYLHTLWLRRFIIHVIKYLKKHYGGKK